MLKVGHKLYFKHKIGTATITRIGKDDYDWIELHEDFLYASNHSGFLAFHLSEIGKYFYTQKEIRKLKLQQLTNET